MENNDRASEEKIILEGIGKVIGREITKAVDDFLENLPDVPISDKVNQGVVSGAIMTVEESAIEGIIDAVLDGVLDFDLESIRFDVQIAILQGRNHHAQDGDYDLICDSNPVRKIIQAIYWNNVRGILREGIENFVDACVRGTDPYVIRDVVRKDIQDAVRSRHIVFGKIV